MKKVMDNVDFRNISDSAPKESVLKRILDLYVEETITDEQVARVLAPVRRMIYEGRFNKPRRVSWLARPLALTASVALITAAIAVAQDNMTRGMFVDIPDTAPPLSGRASAEDTPENLKKLTLISADGMKLTLININSMEIYGPKTAKSDGICTFEDIPEGTYRIMASPPLSTESVDAGTYIVADGKAELVSGGGLKKIWEGVDVQVCPAE